MTHATHIYQNDLLKLKLNGCIKKEKAINLSRNNGLQDRFEIHYFIENLLQAVYYISPDNKISGAVFLGKKTY